MSKPQARGNSRKNRRRNRNQKKLTIIAGRPPVDFHQPIAGKGIPHFSRTGVDSIIRNLLLWAGIGFQSGKRFLDCFVLLRLDILLGIVLRPRRHGGENPICWILPTFDASGSTFFKVGDQAVAVVAEFSKINDASALLQQQKIIL